MQKQTIILLLVLIPFLNFSQESWSLSKCVDYAVKNNIQLNLAENSVALQQINFKESKARILPNLNMGSDLNWNFGRNIDYNTNTVTFQQSMGNSYWIQSSIDIFQGLVHYNSMNFNRFMLKAQKENAEQQRNQLVMQVISAYYTVLYSDGLSKVAHNQVELSNMQFNRMQKLVEIGKESPITAQELKSQWANDKLSLTQAQNNYNSSLLDLKQLLRINTQDEFIIDTITIKSLVINPLPQVDSIFDEAIAILPDIKKQEYLLNASEKDLAIAKGGISPSLSFSAGYGTGFYNGDSTVYRSQLTNNQNQWLVLSLNIPVFNRASTYSNIKRKQIAILNQQMELEKQKDDLYSEICKAVNDLQSAKNEYESSLELDDYSRLNLKNISLKLEKGLASATDFEAAKQRFSSAEASLLKAKLIYVMRNQMVQFYLTGSWGHL